MLPSSADRQLCDRNIFGGITQTDKVAAGIISAYNETPRLASKSVPVVIRIRGTGETEAKKLVCCSAPSSRRLDADVCPTP